MAAAVLVLAAPILCTGDVATRLGPRIFSQFAAPTDHPLYDRHWTKPPRADVFSPTRGVRIPGFCAIRSLPMGPADGRPPVATWEAMIDLFFNSTAEGGYDVANCVWPGWAAVFSPHFPALAEFLRNRHIPAVDLGGFVPGGANDFDVQRGVPGPAYLSQGRAIMNPAANPGDALLMGLDMGEQDVRYLWGYSKATVNAGPADRFAQYLAFRDYSWAIERQSGSTMVSLSSSTYGAHYWHKTGQYTTAGAETSQSNGNTQLLYAFIRGSCKQYGLLWYGQVSIFNWFGYKIPGDANPSPTCQTQQSHSPTCGTSLSLMKRLMYTQLFYDSVYFAFEGQWDYGLQTNRSGLTAIGNLQQQAKRFFSSANGTLLADGVHTPTAAIMLDFFAGWSRPCDSAPFQFKAETFGRLPWDAADYLVDAVFQLVFPGYRAGALRHDEKGYLAPTPYGDSIDVLLSDALPEVLTRYDTVIVAHRLTTEPREVRRKLEGHLASGGHVVITASSVMDLGGTLANVSVDACTAKTAGTKVRLANGSIVAEPRPFVQCRITSSSDASTQVIATMVGDGLPAALRVTEPGGGSMTIIGAGNYSLSNTANSAAFQCKEDEEDDPDKNVYNLVQYASIILADSLSEAALFDLGPRLSWVPKRLADGRYALAVTNSELSPVPLEIKSRTGSISHVEEMALDDSEVGSVGYLPHGYESNLSALGTNTPRQVAGVATRLFIVSIADDSARPIPRFPAAPRPRRLLRLSASTGSVRTELLRRPSFDNHFTGVLVDWEYIESRSPAALDRESAAWRIRNLSVVVDFSSGTTLFPGIRLIDDMHLYWLDSMARITDVLNKMSLLGATDAMFTLHTKSELPPQNFTATPVDSARKTLIALVSQAKALNITCHLRACPRNEHLLGGGMAAQTTFAQSAGLKIAPSFAYSTDAATTTSLLSSGAASILLLSSAWGQDNPTGGGPLSALAANDLASLRRISVAADEAGATVVLDVDQDWNSALDDVALLT